MNVPLSKKQRYRARKKQRLLEQRKPFGLGYQGPLTKPQFQPYTIIHGNKNVTNTKDIAQQIVKKEITSEVIDMNASIKLEPDLTDDNSPSIPLAPTPAQITPQVLKKPSLNIQGKTQEKFKINQRQEEQPNNNQNKEENATLNEEKVETPNENQIEEQNKSMNTTDSHMNESTLNNQTQNQDKPANEVNSGSQIPVLMKQPLTNKNKADNISKNPVQTIPTLTNQSGKPKKIPNTPNPSINYQNIHHVPCPPMLNPGQYPAANLEMLYHSIYAAESGIPRSAFPSGVPMSFLLQQPNFGAIQPQCYRPINPGLLPHIMPMHDQRTNQPTFSQPQIYIDSNFPTNTSTYVNEVPLTVPSQPYSPSDLFTEDGEASKPNEEGRESSSPDLCKVGQRRLSAFERLGPLTQPKKPKLTINLSFNKEQAIREVVGEDESNKYVPVHMREDIINSSDEVVTTHLGNWPWKNPIVVRKSVGARASKSAMIMEQEQMEEVYERGNIFIQLTVKGYPNTWSKEDVLDTLLENLKGKCFVPCFIEFTPTECKFLVIRSRPALVAIHKLGFTARKDDVILHITIYDIDLDIKTINFLPKIVLRYLVMRGLENDTKLNLQEFTLQPDVSHFIYYPLNRTSNQIGIIDLHVAIVWNNLTHLVLSHNRMTSIEGFDLQHTTPLLQYLDISYNNIERITVLLNCRKLPLRSLTLEGNPLCTDYRDPTDYVKVAKMLFPMLLELDGIKIPINGDLPKIYKNYCDIEAKELVDKFLQTYFPILDMPPHERDLTGDMYDTNAILSFTSKSSLLSMTAWRRNRALFFFNRQTDDMIGGCISTVKKIVKFMKKLPNLQHDPTTFTVDVLSHSNTSTIITISGILKITTDSLAEDENMIAFNKTVLLHTNDGVEYKIHNDLLHWDLPSQEYLKQAFTKTAVPLSKKTLSVTLDTPPNTNTKDQLVNIFMNLTELDKPHSERYLAEKDWNIKEALQYFTEIVKLNPTTMNHTSSSELVT
ncbi:PREDICTED: uncharacterized protein LOC106121719 isoform X2 [Papilio xuthus]|uniref:Uncharacterized protein LOC106121719 isoform X2 n=1 Tax=Papilio xuthus TaxID=66420 RepID=A0AAJ7EDH5_PAPXU|nr:PREDICTED: uncharacterized protein LOC106121719 isoform X2 [Papilio xuthus]